MCPRKKDNPNKVPTMNSLLSQFVYWKDVLPHLGVEIVEESLPTITTCPLCSQHGLQVYRDLLKYSLPSEWCICESCGFFGDLFYLTKKAWGLSTEATINKLRKLGLFSCRIPLGKPKRGLHGALKNYVAWEEVYENTEPFLAAGCRQWLPVRDSLDPVRSYLGIDPYRFSTSEWSKTLGRLILLFSKAEIAEKFPNISLGLNISMREYSLLTIPCYSLPKRISGLLLLRTSNQTKKPLINLVPLMRGGIETALAIGFLDPVLQELKKEPKTLIVVDDWSVGPKLQCKYVNQNKKIAPVVFLMEDSTEAANPGAANLKYLPAKDLVLWSPEGLHPKTIWKAAVNDLDISDYSSDTGINTQAEHIIDNIYEHRVSWQEALDRAIFAYGGNGSKVLKEMKLNAVQQKAFHSLCPSQLQKKLFSSKLDRRKIIYVNKRYTVDDDGKKWWDAQNGTLLFDGRVEIIDIYEQPLGGRAIALCEITYRGNTVQKLVEWQYITGKGIGWLRDILQQIDASALLISNEKLKTVTRIALSASTPKLKILPKKAGWNKETASIELPNLSIRTGGSISVHPGERIWGDALPFLSGSNIKYPAVIPPSVIEECSKPYNRSVIFWDIMAAGLRIILGPVRNKPPLQMTLKARTDAFHILTTYGYSLFGRMQVETTTNWCRLAQAYTAESDWPIVWVGRSNRSGASRKLAKATKIAADMNLFEEWDLYLLETRTLSDKPSRRRISATRYSAAPGYLAGCANVLNYKMLARIQASQNICRYASDLLVHYLSNVAKRRFDINPTARWILRDLKTWFEKTYKVKADEVFARANAILWDTEEDDLELRFIRLLYDFITPSTVRPRVFNMLSKSRVEKEGVCLKRDKFLKEIDKKLNVGADLEELEQKLLEAKLVIPEKDQDGNILWKLPEHIREKVAEAVKSENKDSKEVTSHTEMPDTNLMLIR